MQLVRYNPFNELQKMEHDINKFWQNDFSFPSVSLDQTAVDMYEEDGKLIAEMNLPQFKKEEVTVSSDNGMLEITARHQDKQEKSTKRRYLLKESSSEYYRRIALPEGADGEKAEANYKDGVLKVTMPMEMPKQPKAIDIK